jgi:hypothetical protein
MRAARGSSLRFSTMLAACCPLWRDCRTYRLRDGSAVLLVFLKRAQLCAAMVQGCCAGEGGAPVFHDMHELTVFSDYRLPQLLRALGILVLAPELARAVDAKELLREGSEEEVEVRAATIHAAELLHKAVVAAATTAAAAAAAQRGGGGAGGGGRGESESGVSSALIHRADLDYYLWKLAVARASDSDSSGSGRPKLPEFHRTRTIAY